MAGFVRHRIRGDHLIMVKAGIPRPIVIPRYDEIGMDIIQANLRTAGISREHYLKLLSQV